MKTKKQQNAPEERDLVLLSPKKLVRSQGKRAITSSLKVADIFGIPHHNVFRAIENLDCVVSEEFYVLNFAKRGHKSIDMTKNGFSTLNMILGELHATQLMSAIETYLSEFDYVEYQLHQSHVTKHVPVSVSDTDPDPQYFSLMEFWSVVEKLNVDNAINHSNNLYKELALSIDQVYACCAEQKLVIPQFKLVKPLLVSDTYRPFIANKPIFSRLTKKTTRCWIFKIN